MEVLYVIFELNKDSCFVVLIIGKFDGVYIGY